MTKTGSNPADLISFEVIPAKIIVGYNKIIKQIFERKENRLF